MWNDWCEVEFEEMKAFLGVVLNMGTSLVLAEELLQMKCHITGTIQKNRKHIPQGISNPKFINSNIIAMRHSNYLLLAWKDKRIVTMLSTYHAFGSRVMTRSS